MRRRDPIANEAPVQFREISPAVEFCAWVMVILAPLLRLANGAPVTSDQWYLQIAVAVLSLLTAVTLRIYNWRTHATVKPPQPADDPNDKHPQ